ncbi:MAG: hypothetical protein ACXW4E_03850 [Anaerolineales bacterium]
MKVHQVYHQIKQYFPGGTSTNQIFDWCVNVLICWANIFGITYKEITVWVFVILWPLLTLLLICIIVMQYRTIRRLSRR